MRIARYEKDLGEAWNHVNSADKLLPLVVDEGDLDRCTVRIRGWDKGLIELDSRLKEKLEDIDRAQSEIWDEETPIPDKLREILNFMLIEINIMLKIENIKLLDKQNLEYIFNKLKNSIENKKTLWSLKDEVINEINHEFDESLDRRT